MRVVFMGANRTGWLCLNELLRMGENVVGIFTLPPRFSISYSNKPIPIATYQAFDDLAQAFDIPREIVTGSLNALTTKLQALKPDLILVNGWYHKIPEKILRIPPRGVVGFHPSLLPKYRGGAPLTWSLINDERETGMTLFYMEEGIDTGDIVAQERVPIATDDTIATLYEKVNQAMLSILRESWPRLKEGRVPRRAQDESQATYFPNRGPEDGLILWSWPSRKIYNWIRAQTTP